ncbi:hypothetical protein J3D54_005154 [Pseudomonas sp. GGS8]|nr:ATP-binding domain-containing protein [Pseudomonas sp. GGS8]MCP1446022.1 hypothetical protein [Pseudomonas sp. GGS8]
MYLGTVHSAKGLEFHHVGLLDGGWSTEALSLDAERRLYYVGMTRAEETLTLCEFDSGNPFSRQLSRDVPSERHDGEFDPRLARCYIQLTLGEIDIGFAGSSTASQPLHRAVAELQVSDPLTFKYHGDRYLLLDALRRIVGRTAKSFVPDIAVDQCHVEGIVVRYAAEGDPQFHASLKVEAWEVVIPRVSGMPRSKSHDPSLQKSSGRHPRQFPQQWLTHSSRQLLCDWKIAASPSPGRIFGEVL